MKKTYFIKTFRINNCLMGIAILSIMIRFLLEIMSILLLSDANFIFIHYTQFIKKYVLLFGNSLERAILIVIALLLLLILPELVFRITKDSLLNYIKSYWITFRLRKFLIKQTDYDIESDTKIQKHNFAIKKSVIDIRNDNILFIIKLPNDHEIQKSITDTTDGLREEISSQFPYYVFSSFERKKHLLILEGTRFR
ncbi:hypothetical protein NGC16_06220 [Enterococcus hirae]|uniref:hypothetical protein n=1 Tax=Enterococcus hirae TaxID=1354 RepID=UPI00280F37E3|nr:hypothetical protein [Enterococcus hirae]MDQ8534878.1 hypothetical protein [Enterococcus faecium]MEB7494772.1 hypothetical protein [Enterococcus hirae]